MDLHHVDAPVDVPIQVPIKASAQRLNHTLAKGSVKVPAKASVKVPVKAASKAQIKSGKTKAKKKRSARHGTYSEYVHHGCRCALCTEEARLYGAKYRHRPISEKNITHGKASSYNSGCRCSECTRANRERNRY